MNRRRFLKEMGYAAAGLTLAGCGESMGRSGAQKQQRPPNIVLIMADDMGFSDIGCYGGEIATPNINRLAAEGLRFTQFYNTARCCPTRASLLTGLYAHQTGMGWMTAADLGRPGYTGDLNNKCITIAEALKPAGYRCYMSGKWHVTSKKYTGPDGPKHNWPLQRGFDTFYGTVAGGGSYYNPPTLTRDNERIKPQGEDYYYTDAISDNAVTFVRRHSAEYGEEPFFMYVAYTSPHWPLHAKPADIAKYKGKYLKGWDALRQARHRRLVQMKILDDKWQMQPRDEKVNAWEKVDENKKKLWDLRMAVYAAQVDCMDQGIGRIINALRETDRLDNTLIMFLSDNGGCAEWISQGDKGLDTLGTKESFESYRRAWANASNTPFQKYKHWVHEGGIATPFVVRWPKVIRHKGNLCRTVGHVIDIMPTCLEAAGASYPAEYKSEKLYPLEGKSLVAAFAGGTVEREALYFEHEANRAIRAGRWKLVSASASNKPPYLGPWELYDMHGDRTETQNLADKYPEKVRKLAAMWDDWAQTHMVLPLDGRGWNTRIKASR